MREFILSVAPKRLTFFCLASIFFKVLLELIVEGRGHDKTF